MILKGDIECEDMGKFLLPYINFGLNKKLTARVAIHLRNCPCCMEKYSDLQKRKKYLKKRYIETVNKLRCQNDISCYTDSEYTEKAKFATEMMIQSSLEYKKELIENKELKNMLKEAKRRIQNEMLPKNAIKIIAQI